MSGLDTGEMDGGCNDRLPLVNVPVFTRIAECKLSITEVGPDPARSCRARIYQRYAPRD